MISGSEFTPQVNFIISLFAASESESQKCKSAFISLLFCLAFCFAAKAALFLCISPSQFAKSKKRDSFTTISFLLSLKSESDVISLYFMLAIR